MKTTEMYVNAAEAGFKVEHQPRQPVNPLTAEQKYHIILALIFCVAFIAALFKIGGNAILGAAGILLMFGAYQAIKNM